MTDSLHPATHAAHGGEAPRAPFYDVAPPLHLSTTFTRNAEGSYPGGRVYSRDQSPAYDGPERLLAELEGGEQALLFSSGMAAAAALDIVAAVAALNQQRHADGLPTLRVRIGIESGLALVGDLGTSFRSSYTAIGDCINFASRLESAARTLPADIIIGAAAAQRIRAHTLRPLGSLQLRGAEVMMEVFTVEPR